MGLHLRCNSRVILPQDHGQASKRVEGVLSSSHYDLRFVSVRTYACRQSFTFRLSLVVLRSTSLDREDHRSEYSRYDCDGRI